MSEAIEYEASVLEALLPAVFLANFNVTPDCGTTFDVNAASNIVTIAVPIGKGTEEFSGMFMVNELLDGTIYKCSPASEIASV